MEAEAWREDSARRKERKVATLGRKFESFVVGKLRKSLGGWMSWAKGDWAVSLAGKEYTGVTFLATSHLSQSHPSKYPNPIPIKALPPPFPQKKRKKEKKKMKAKIK